MIDTITAIVALDSTAKVSVNGDDVTWHDGNPNGITAEQITAKQAELQAEYDSKEYARNRATAYAPLGEQLDMQYHDSVTGSRTWLDHVEEIKARFPK